MSGRSTAEDSQRSGRFTYLSLNLRRIRGVGPASSDIPEFHGMALCLPVLYPVDLVVSRLCLRTLRILGHISVELLRAEVMDARASCSLDLQALINQLSFVQSESHFCGGTRGTALLGRRKPTSLEK